MYAGQGDSRENGPCRLPQGVHRLSGILSATCHGPSTTGLRHKTVSLPGSLPSPFHLANLSLTLSIYFNSPRKPLITAPSPPHRPVPPPNAIEIKSHSAFCRSYCHRGHLGSAYPHPAGETLGRHGAMPWAGTSRAAASPPFARPSVPPSARHIIHPSPTSAWAGRLSEVACDASLIHS